LADLLPLYDDARSQLQNKDENGCGFVLTSDPLRAITGDVVSALVDAELRLIEALEDCNSHNPLGSQHATAISPQDVGTILATARRISGASRFSPFFRCQLPWPDGPRDARRPVALVADPFELEAQLHAGAPDADQPMEEDSPSAPEVGPANAMPDTAPAPPVVPTVPAAVAPPAAPRIQFTALCDSDGEDEY